MVNTTGISHIIISDVLCEGQWGGGISSACPTHDPFYYLCFYEVEGDNQELHIMKLKNTG